MKTVCGGHYRVFFWALLLVLLFCMFLMSPAVQASPVFDKAPPPSLKDLQDIKKVELFVPDDDGEVETIINIRKEAAREAALSYGARGGLAWRTYFIRRSLEDRASYMEKVFDFRQLLIPAPSGLLIEPPIITESINALIIDGGGQEAAVADRVYQIGRNARIVSAPRTWRVYLERDWGSVEAPPDILRPENFEERQNWKRWVELGWNQGIQQADQIFETDLARLVSDFRGMVRYRMLLTQGMVSPPFALQVDRGVTGGGDEMRVGDRAVSITGVPALKPGSQRWQPANR